MAYIVGTFLIILVCVGVPLKYLTTTGTEPQQAGQFITTYLGILHGYLYMIFLVMAALLARKARFPLGFTALILVLGTVPFLSFWGERKSTHRVRAQLAAQQPLPAPVEPPPATRS